MPFVPFIAAIDIGKTVSTVLDSLGIFGWLFLFIMLVILFFLGHGWRLVGRHVCPVNFERGIDDSTRQNLAELATKGMSAEQVSAVFFDGGVALENNLFFSYLIRFGRRNRGTEPSPSLVNATEEQYVIARVQHVSNNVRFLSTVLPALGLLGTLIGMFNAFFSTNLLQGDELAGTMQQLMQSFALALFTTILAVILKIAVDLFNHFTLSAQISQMRIHLGQLRSELLDAACAPAPDVDVPEENPEPTEPEPDA